MTLRTLQFQASLVWICYPTLRVDFERLKYLVIYLFISIYLLIILLHVLEAMPSLFFKY